MKKLILNLLSFSVVTLGLAAAIYQVQAQGNLRAESSHVGHVHSDSESREETGHIHESEEAEHDDAHEEVEMCTEHNLPETQCGICQPQLAAQLKPGESLKVRLAAAEAIQKVGIENASPTQRAIQTDQSFLCEVSFNQERAIHISTLAGGVIQKVFANLGDEVKEGQTLLELASTDIAKAKSEYIKAVNLETLKHGAYQREKELVERNISARQDFHQAESDLRMAETETKTARQQLANFGFSAREIAALEKQQNSSSALKVMAPFSGVLIEKHAVPGEAIEAGESLMELVNLSTMWLKLSIPESLIGKVKKGEKISAAFEALPDQKIQGAITWISPRINQETRFVQAIAEVGNPDGSLKEGLFGVAFLGDSTPQICLAIPNSAIQEVDGKPFVFVQTGDDLYDLRCVALGKKSKTHTEILAGLQPPELIATGNSFVLKSEFLKSRFGAGCTHD